MGGVLDNSRSGHLTNSRTARRTVVSRSTARVSGRLSFGVERWHARLVIFGASRRDGRRNSDSRRSPPQISHPQCRGFFDSAVVVGAAEVLDERVPGADHPCAAETFQTAHRP
jgi:hypothetical protein